MKRLMNCERPSSGTGSWNDANAALFGATRETIDSRIRESQCLTFHRSAGGGIDDGVPRRSMIESVNGMDASSPRVHFPISLTLLQNRLHGQKAWWMAFAKLVETFQSSNAL